ncbi:unnamed protein product [Adineta steineri]|uniref:Ankyrin and armadillo repeat-containing protein n=1 Tax=Adineta steineri TaxID=433720 RepID=A0A815UWX4_9BILA|nr:unnamed protein product [Adineta steineri]CAF1525075.1 unnamed protein product [Adineta steineri]
MSKPKSGARTPSHSAKGSASSRGGESIDDGVGSSNTYDNNGYLPIHRAVFNGYEVTLKNILDDALKRNELNQQLEAKTEKTELTPLLLATAVGRIQIISFLLKYPVNINAVDVNQQGIVAIAALSQNERTLRYIIELPVADNSLNVWKPLFKLFTSLGDDESSIGGRALELLTRPKADTNQGSIYWQPIIVNGLIPALVDILTESKNDDVLTSAYLILLHAVNEQPRIHNDLISNKKVFSSMLRHTRSTNKEIVTLIGRLFASLTKQRSLGQTMVEQSIFEPLMTLIDKERSPEVISSYFDCLANIVSYSSVYQIQIANYPFFLQLLIDHYLQEFDLDLSLSVMNFVRQLVLNNQDIQNLLAENGACEHILGALTASSKDLQQIAIETIRAFGDNNPQVQYIMISENALEQLLNLLDKTTVASLQIAIVCTLWTLCGDSASRKRDVATRIGVKKLISLYNIKSEEHLYALTDIIGELTKRTASVKTNIAEEINRAVGLPPIIRLLTLNNEQLVLSALKTLQLLACAPGYIPNQLNQEAIVKFDGIPFIVALMMHVKNELIQVEAAQTLACIALGNTQCLTLIETTLDFSYTCLLKLIQSKNSTVQLKASNALATFIYNNQRLEMFLARECQFSFAYFEKFLENNNDHIRCAAAFQIVALADFIHEQSQAMSAAIGCGILMDILRLSRTDEAKSDAAECIARLAHMKPSIPHALIAANAIDYLCDLFSSTNDTTIGIASIALGYLSYVPEGQRKLLHRCRGELDIMAFLKVYNCLPGTTPRMSKHLLEAWDRYNSLKLPKLRPRGSNVRYFKVLANSIERLRAPPQPNIEKESISSNPVKFYLPPIRQKVN